MVTPAAKREAVADGLDARDSRVHNYPPHWNGAPSQELLVIRRNHHLRPNPAAPMRIWPISTRVNKPENDDPSILQPIELSAA